MQNKEESTEQNTYSRKAQIEKQVKAHSTNEFGLSIDVAGAQVQAGTDHAKAIVGWPHQGVGALGVRPHPSLYHLGLVAPSSYMPPCYMGPWWFPILRAPNRPWISIKEEELTFTHTPFWSYPTLSTCNSLVLSF